MCISILKIIHFTKITLFSIMFLINIKNHAEDTKQRGIFISKYVNIYDICLGSGPYALSPVSPD